MKEQAMENLLIKMAIENLEQRLENEVLKLQGEAQGEDDDKTEEEVN